MTVLWITLTVLLALALSTVVGYFLTVWVLRSAEGARPVTSSGDGKEAPPPASAVLRGGTWIGILERIAIAGTIMAGYPAAIAVVIAIKGLGRFPELRAASVNSEVSERFIIGTLASCLWAAAMGLAARGVLIALG